MQRARRRCGLGPAWSFAWTPEDWLFFSQLGVARRPDLTQYFVDGFTRNRDAPGFQ